MFAPVTTATAFSNSPECGLQCICTGASNSGKSGERLESFLLQALERTCHGGWGLFCQSSASMVLFTSSFIHVSQQQSPYPPVARLSLQFLGIAGLDRSKFVFSFFSQPVLSVFAFCLSAFLQFTFLYSLELPLLDLLHSPVQRPSILSFQLLFLCFYQALVSIFTPVHRP